MALDDLPYVDEHHVDVAAVADDVWDAALEVFGAFGSAPARTVARLLGADPSGRTAWPEPGGTIPGFRVVVAERPRLLVIAGRHRFSRYGIVLRVEPTATGARCSLESRAAFPGIHGTAYRAAVVGTRFHVLAVRRLLRSIAQAATS